MKNRNYVVRFSGNNSWIDLEMPRVALKDQRLFRRWFNASCKRHGIDILKEMPQCKGISKIAAGDGYRWHSVRITFSDLL